MHRRGLILRCVVLVSLLLIGHQAVEPIQYSQAQDDPEPPAGISSAAWEEILSQVQADVQSTAADPLLTTAVKKLTALDGASSDKYGISVGVSGDTAVIGAYNATVGGSLQRGAAYIYQRNRGGAADNWGEVTKLTAYDGAAYDYFGVSVAISGDTVVVGAMGADISGQSNQGAAYIYRRNAGGADQWGLMKKIVAGDGAAGDYYGGAVAVSGWMLAVGADSADISGRSSQGAVYVYYRNQGGMDFWGQWKKLIASDGLANNYFGGALALSNDTLVVGAWGADVSGILGQGAAYVYGRNKDGADQWGQVKKLTSMDGAAYDRFGYVVALNAQADTLVVGATQADVGGASNRGAAYVFTRNQGGSAENWGQVQKLAASDGAASDQFGRSVAVNQNRILVGAIGDESNRGAVYRYEVNQGGLNQWGQVEKLVAWDGAANDNLGTSVSLNETGDIAILGTPGDESWRGGAYVFSWQGVNWQEQKRLEEEESGGFSSQVAINGDTLVVGAYATSVGGQDYAGAAYVFSRNWGGADHWGLVKKLIASDYAAEDYFGDAVAISGDTLVVGAWLADISGYEDAGAAYVFNRNWGGTDNWGQEKKLIAIDFGSGDYFGRSVAISGDTIVVGAYPADINGQIDAGATYVFTRNLVDVENWGLVKKLIASDYSFGSYFGSSVSISGDTLVVGAYSADVNGELSAGAAYVFSHNWGGMDNWGQVKKLVASDYHAGDNFGWSVAIDGDTLVIGSIGADFGLVYEVGAAYLFLRNLGGAENWGQLKKLVASDYAKDDRFGYSVAINGDNLIVGAEGIFFPDLEHNGAAYIYTRNWGGVDSWELVRKLPSNCEIICKLFGSSVALDGSTAVIGSPYGNGAAFICTENNAALFIPLLLR